MFDQMCNDNGIKHLLTAPYSPARTGKIERLHKTIRPEFLTEPDRRHATIEEAQAGMDTWLVEYNTGRPHQSCGGRPPVERFALAERGLVVVDDLVTVPRRSRKVGRCTRTSAGSPGTTRGTTSSVSGYGSLLVNKGGCFWMDQEAAR
jgi:hypothetical protein